ncbi:hypothetical protein GCM10009664_12570 [Kitasatospora gansuensis]
MRGCGALPRRGGPARAAYRTPGSPVRRIPYGAHGGPVGLEARILRNSRSRTFRLTLGEIWTGPLSFAGRSLRGAEQNTAQALRRRTGLRTPYEAQASGRGQD